MTYHLWKSDLAESVYSEMKIENGREDMARWRRYYSGSLDNRCKIEIEANTFLGRNFRGTLTQPNGNEISFDPARIADKIIDPLLVPLVSAQLRRSGLWYLSFFVLTVLPNGPNSGYGDPPHRLPEGAAGRVARSDGAVELLPRWLCR